MFWIKISKQRQPFQLRAFKWNRLSFAQPFGVRWCSPFQSPIWLWTWHNNEQSTAFKHCSLSVQKTRSVLPTGCYPIVRLVAGKPSGAIAWHDDDRMWRCCHHQTVGSTVESGWFGSQRVLRTGRHRAQGAQNHPDCKRISARHYIFNLAVWLRDCFIPRIWWIVKRKISYPLCKSDLSILFAYQSTT